MRGHRRDWAKPGVDEQRVLSRSRGRGGGSALMGVWSDAFLEWYLDPLPLRLLVPPSNTCRTPEKRAPCERVCKIAALLESPVG